MAAKLTTRGLLQSSEEYAARNNVLSSKLAELVIQYTRPKANRGLDVGCQNGWVLNQLSSKTALTWWGIDPAIKEPRTTSAGAQLLPGWAHQIPFPDAHFDCLIFANVYEHVSPELRSASLVEMKRVLVQGGTLIGQLPNPYFPIESHSRLPFMGWLPRWAQLLYWRLTPVDYEHDFYVVTIRHLKRTAIEAGFEPVLICNFNYPIEVIPHSVRWAARLLERPMQIIPWAWQFVFKKL